jgi:hypothetical protein
MSEHAMLTAVSVRAGRAIYEAGRAMQNGISKPSVRDETLAAVFNVREPLRQL